MRGDLLCFSIRQLHENCEFADEVEQFAKETGNRSQVALTGYHWIAVIYDLFLWRCEHEHDM